MDNEKKIKILEKENMRLQAEIDRLNEQITDSRTLQDRYDELDSLKEKWEKETEILCQSGMKFLNVFDTYRREKKINTRQLIQGVISERAFMDIKKEKHILMKSD